MYAFSRRIYPKRLAVHSGYTFIVSMCVPWELNPQPFFALLTQCSTTEPQEHFIYIKQHFILRSNSHYYQTITIRCLLIVSKVVVKFRYWLGLGVLNMVLQNMCFIHTNKKLLYINNRHANNKQLVNIENWSLY